MLVLGKGVKVDIAEAMRWFRTAAKAGHLKAMFWLGTSS